MTEVRIIEPVHDEYDTGEDYQECLVGVFTTIQRAVLTRYPIEEHGLWRQYQLNEIDIICNPTDESKRRNPNALILIPENELVCCTGYCSYRKHSIWANTLYKGLYGFIQLDYLKKNKKQIEVCDVLNNKEVS